MPRQTRFAPSPTGFLHIGHAYSALFAWHSASGGTMRLRIEDIDTTRCRPDFAAAIEEDLAWLGLTWPVSVRRQSDHLAAYRDALARLDQMGLLYPCFCTRGQLAAVLSAPHGTTPAYPGFCRGLSPEIRAERIAAGEAHALRLDTTQGLRLTGPLSWRDLDQGEVPARPDLAGDVVLARKEIQTSYHLAVTLDDAAEEIELVTRGRDLFEATHIHRLLQALLGLPVPVWRHHDLVADQTGKRLAKRDGARPIRAYREAGHSPAEIRALAGFPD
jgi:glutamyl-Q tRNA(Asp) synthetase